MSDNYYEYPKEYCGYCGYDPDEPNDMYCECHCHRPPELVYVDN